MLGSPQNNSNLRLPSSNGEAIESFFATRLQECEFSQDRFQFTTTLEEFTADPFEISLRRPSNWLPIALPKFDHNSQGGPVAAWANTDQSENLICGYGVLASGVPLEAIALTPAVTMQQAGLIKIDMLDPELVTLDNGANGYRVKFGGRTHDGKDYFKNILVLEVAGYWISIEASLHAEGRRQDYPEFIHTSENLLNSICTQMLDAE